MGSHKERKKQCGFRQGERKNRLRKEKKQVRKEKKQVKERKNNSAGLEKVDRGEKNNVSFR